MKEQRHKCGSSFNEAAAIRCGSRAEDWIQHISDGCFNEAAAIRCGSRAILVNLQIPVFLASMRPQLFAADHQLCSHVGYLRILRLQ